MQRRSPGRPPLLERPIQIKVYIPEEIVAAIDRARGAVPRSEWIREACVQRLQREGFDVG